MEREIGRKEGGEGEKGEEGGGGRKGMDEKGGDLTFMFLLSKNSRTSSSVHSYERFPRKTVYGGSVGRWLGSTEANG